MKNPLKVNGRVIIEPENLQGLLEILNKEGYKILGPTIRQNAVIYDELTSIRKLPVGRRDVQNAGTYRLMEDGRGTFFGYGVGAQSWKKYFHPPEMQLWRVKREGAGFHIVEEKEQIPKYALIGVRPCEIHAIHSLDSVFNTKEFSDPVYNATRKKVFIVAVNCTEPGGTCFCASMKTGPKAESGFDIALTEMLDKGLHYFMAEAGTEKGADVLKGVAHRHADEAEQKNENALLEAASEHMGRHLNTSNLKAVFYENFEHPHWEKVAKRCLTCGNCTMVCPTCFCNTIVDANTLTGDYAERRRQWDSCFTIDFSYIHGGSIRISEKSRYRQWLTHKLVTWEEQFGTSGCVGCGRCITWCPVGIDITQEAKTILEEAHNPVT